MQSEDSRYRFVVRNLNYPHSEAAVWEIRDTDSKRTIFTSDPYSNEEECKKDLKMLLRSHVITVSLAEKEVWID